MRPRRSRPRPSPFSRRSAALRTELAREDSVPAYVVASDRTLRDIALAAPARARRRCKLAHGIGPAKAERYGARILAVVARATAPR